MTLAEELASFAVRATYEDLSEPARHQLKLRVLDSLGCAIGALKGEPVRLVREHLEDLGYGGRCTLIGGEHSSPERAALYNGALVRYLDFNDTYVSKGESCHPSDNLSAVLAASEYARVGGKDLLAALAVAYQVQCRLCDVAPVRARGFDHTTQGAYAVSAGVSRALGLDAERATNAIAIGGTAFNALRVTRTGSLSHWKGLAYPSVAFSCTHAALLAGQGVTGPRQVFEGSKGFMDTIAGPFSIDWAREDLERVLLTSIKKHNAEFHSQPAIEAVLELMASHGFRAADVVRVEIETFDVAYNIIGGGEGEDKTTVRTKEEADHSLPYIVAVALLDQQVLPEQYTPERIGRQDVQELLGKVTVRPNRSYSDSFPEQMPCSIRVSLEDGRTLMRERWDYEGYHTSPMSWEAVVQKFESLASPYADSPLRLDIVQAVASLESITVQDLSQLLAKVRYPHIEN